MQDGVALTLNIEPTHHVVLEGVHGIGRLVGELEKSDFHDLYDQWERLKDANLGQPIRNELLFEFAERISHQILPVKVREALYQERNHISANGSRIRLRFSIHTPFELPAEVLTIHSSCEPIGLDASFSPSRFIDSASWSELDSSEEIRVLIAIADPVTPQYPKLGWIEEEVRALHASLGGKVQLRILTDTLPSTLRRNLHRFRPHVFHFSGHGDVLPTGPVLVAQGATTGSATYIRKEELILWLREANTSVAVFMACMTSELAKELVNAGLSAAIGMQLPLRTGAAPALSRSIYQAWVTESSLDEAVAESRQVLRDRDGDWLAPVLYCSRTPGPLTQPIAAGPENLPPHNLTSIERRFVGRHQERVQVRRLIQNESTRLVVLTGIGGIGKSRLARVIAEDLLPSFRDGVWLIPGDAIRDGSALLAAAQSKVVPDSSPAVEPSESLLGKRFLLVLDACESWLPSGGDHAIRTLLNEVPGAYVLATSRVALSIDGGVQVSIGPMAVPEESDVNPEGHSESIELLVQAAREGVPSFRPSPEELLILEQICRDVQGVPLALILAAARLRYMGVAELAELVRASKLRALGGNQADPRGHIMGVVESTVSMIRRYDFHFLSRLAVFHASFGMADIVAVHSYDRFEAADAVGRLRDHSLIESSVVDGKTRYRLLDTIREYVLSAMSEETKEEWDFICRNHATYFALRAKKLVESTRDGSGSAGLWLDLGNFREAIRFSYESKLALVLGDLATNLARTFFESGLWSDLDYLLEAARWASEYLGDRALLSRMLGIEGALAARRGNYLRSRQCWEERATICEELGDKAGQADALLDVIGPRILGDPPHEVRRSLDEATDAAYASGRSDLVATAYIMQALLSQRFDEPDQALQWAIKTQQLERVPTIEFSYLFVDTQLGNIYVYLQDFEKAEVAYVRALRWARQAERRHHVAGALLGLSRVYAATSRPAIALRSITAALHLYSALGSKWRGRAEETREEISQRFPDASQLARYTKANWGEVADEILGNET